MTQGPYSDFSSLTDDLQQQVDITVAKLELVLEEAEQLRHHLNELLGEQKFRAKRALEEMEQRYRSTVDMQARINNNFDGKFNKIAVR